MRPTKAVKETTLLELEKQAEQMTFHPVLPSRAEREESGDSDVFNRLHAHAELHYANSVIARTVA